MATKLKPEERRALAKVAAAACFVAGGPRLSDELSAAAYGAVRRSVYLSLMKRGLIEMRNGFKLTPLGTHALDIE